MFAAFKAELNTGVRSAEFFLSPGRIKKPKPQNPESLLRLAGLQTGIQVPRGPPGHPGMSEARSVKTARQDTEAANEFH